MEIRFLQNKDLDNVYSTFIESFSDYAVPIQMEKEKLFRMMKRRGAVLEYSVGAFDKKKMVAVMVTAVDDYYGIKSAYDVFTGVIPSHRGQKLAGEMFDYAKPILTEKGIKQFVLEVLQENAPAIKVYEKTGFKVSRTFECYEIESITKLDVERCSFIVNNAFKPNEIKEFRQWRPSWQNCDASIGRTVEKIKCIEAYYDEDLVGYAVVVPSSGDLPQFAVAPEFRERGIGTRLLYEASVTLESNANLRLINIQGDQERDLKFIKVIGAKKLTSQYEMVLPLN